MIGAECSGGKVCQLMAAPNAAVDLVAAPLAPLGVPARVPFLENEAPEMELARPLVDLLPDLVPNDPRLQSDVVNLSQRIADQ